MSGEQPSPRVGVRRDCAADIGIAVRDVAHMLAFYRDGLGLDEVVRDPALTVLSGRRRTLAEFEAGASRIKLWCFEADPPPAPEPERLEQAGLRYLTLRVTGIDALAARLDELGFPLPDPPRDATFMPGVRLAFAQDPDGNWIELLEDMG